MRIRNLLLALAIAFGCFSALVLTLPALAGGRPAPEQDAGGEEPGYVLNIYATADGQVLIQPAEAPCPECGDDEPGGPGVIPPPYPIGPFTGPFSVAQVVYETMTGTNMAVASTSGAVIIQGAAGYECVDEAPADFVAAGYVAWEGALDCPGNNILPFLSAKYLMVATNSMDAGSITTTNPAYNQVAVLWPDQVAIYSASDSAGDSAGDKALASVEDKDPSGTPECLYCCWPLGVYCERAPLDLEAMVSQVELYIQGLISK